MASLTIFANFRINDEERLQRMKDSLQSFKDIEAEKWVVNVRGGYKWDAMFYLHEQLGKKLVPYMLESKKGWFHDSRQMLKDLQTDFVLFWIEDHLNMASTRQYKYIFEEMKQMQVDFLPYSWFTREMQDRYKGIPKKQSKNIEVFTMDRETYRIVQKNRSGSFIISMIGIFSIELFRRLITENKPSLRRWPKDCPFDFEKRAEDTMWLPFRQAIPRHELFASIDTDHGYPGEKCSLQSRQLYPRRVTREGRVKDKEPLRGLDLVYRLAVPRVMRDFFRRLSYHF